MAEEIPCKECIFKGKCPSENIKEVYEICKNIECSSQTKE